MEEERKSYFEHIRSTPLSETPTDRSTTPQLTPDTPVSIREESPTMNDADQSQGHLLLQDILPAQAVLSNHHQNARTLLIIKDLQDLIICMDTGTVYLIIHLEIELILIICAFIIVKQTLFVFIATVSNRN